MTQMKMEFELTREESMVWDIVKLHRGRDSAIVGPLISHQTGINYDRVREIISHLIRSHSRLIASCSKGYYVPVTPGEVEAATKSLRHRGISILARAAKLQRVSLEEIFKQSRIEFKG